MVRPADERKNRTQDQRDNPSASPNGVIVPNHRNQVVFAEASLGIVGQTTAWITENPVRVHAAHFGELSCALFDEMPRPTVRIKLSVYVPTAGGLHQSKGLVMIQLLQLDQRGCFLERLASPSHTTVPGFPYLARIIRTYRIAPASNPTSRHHASYAAGMTFEGLISLRPPQKALV
jgi:hypothetical protein